MIHNLYFQLLIAAAALSATAPFYMRIPRINQYFFFGRALPEAFISSAAAQEISRRYQRQMRTGLMIAFALLLILSGAGRLSPFAALGVALLYLYIFFHIRFALAHRAAGAAFAASGPVQREAAEQGISVPLLQRDRQSQPALWQILLPGAVMSGIWIGGALASHQSLSSFSTLADAMGGSTLVGLSLGMQCAATVFALLLRYTARQRTPLARRNMRVGIALAWIATAIFAGVVLTILLHGHIAHMIGSIAVIVLLGFAILHSFYCLEKGNKYTPASVEFNSDDCWRWGLYYHNPADPALFVQSRALPGYTLNFANIFSWPIALAVYGNFVFLFCLSMRW